MHLEQQPMDQLRDNVNMLAEQAKNFGKDFYVKTKHAKIKPQWIAPPMLQIECDAQAHFEAMLPKQIAVVTHCHFGHPTQARMYKQDLVPLWRGAPIGAILCYKCRHRLNYEIDTADHPLITATTTPPCKLKLNGPCVFGHTTTSAQGTRGEPRWHHIPTGMNWRGAETEDVICFACFQRMHSSNELSSNRSKPRKENVDDYFASIRNKMQKLALGDVKAVETMIDDKTEPQNSNNEIRNSGDPDARVASSQSF